MIATKKYVDETLKSHNLTASKALGQNFLVEYEIAMEIVDNATINDDTCVIEIGPGMGALTEHILKKAKKLIAFEIDSNMVTILKENFSNCLNFELNNIDFLKVDLEKLIEDIKSQGFKDIIILSNLPYYITSKIINKIILNNLEVKEFIAMMQKEVGQKITKPAKKDYNLLSVILDYQYEVSVVKYVGKNSYLPRPEIDSIVLKFKKVEPRFDVKFDSLLKVSDGLFTNRRKTIYNNMKNIFTSNEEILLCLEKTKIDQITRVEQLDIKQIVDIVKYFERK